ncbi:MAG: XRE family transcriptional regulator [Burkholderiales bacterium]
MPELLIWARETAGMSREVAAARLGIGKTRRAAPHERLQQFEAGESEITDALLAKMSKVYRRPLVAFYLPAPPRKGDRGVDFRSVPERTTQDEPLVDALVRDVRARQSMIKSILLEEATPPEPIRFVGSISQEDGLQHATASLQHVTRFDLAEFRAQGTAEGAFALLRNKVEALGVFVLLIGDLGNHHSALSVDAFRGFSLADPLAPLIVINDQDAKAAWSFTLLHELAHLAIGATGVSGRFAEGRLEQFCSDIASHMLLPAPELLGFDVNPNTAVDEVSQEIGGFAAQRLVSRSLVAYRLFRDARIHEATWRTLVRRFQQEWLENKEARRERRKVENEKGGPSYYIVRRHRLGAHLLRFVAAALSEGTLSTTKAGKILGVKPLNVQPLLTGASLLVGQGEG